MQLDVIQEIDKLIYHFYQAGRSFTPPNLYRVLEPVSYVISFG